MKLRADDATLEAGDIAIHEEEAYPDESLVAGRVGAGS
jgi:ammonium transporter, Amt family